MRLRIVPALAVAALVTGSLAACGSVTTDASCIVPIGPGALSESVIISGSTATDLQAQMIPSTSIVNTQRSTLIESQESSTRVTPGEIVAANFAYFDTASGQQLQIDPTFGSGTFGSVFLASEESGPLVASLMCASEGETVAIALSPQASSEMGITGSTVVAVVEIGGVYSSKASGSPKNLPFGFPAVTTNELGQPGVVLPPQSAPTTVKSALRIAGEGQELTADNGVIGNVLTVGWNGEVIVNTFATGPQGLGTETDIAQSGNTYRSALTGHRVGSQVVVIEPNNGQPIVSVIDILATV